jgi:outer membrane lipoprotein-sorting protein
MKRLSVLGLFVASLLFGTVQAQTVDEVVNKHIEAIGGKDNWMKVNSLKSEAVMNVQGMDIPMTIYQVNNKASRQEFTAMNMTGYFITRQDSGWTYMPFMGQTAPEPMPADALNMAKDQLDLQDLLDYGTKGHKVELLGKEDIDGTEAFKLKITSKLGNEKTIFIDTKNYYMIRAIAKVSVNGQVVEAASDFSNYQKLPEGIVVPFTLQTAQSPAPMNFKKYEVNPVIPDSIFQPGK